MEQIVLNPVTERWIKVGHGAWNKLTPEEQREALKHVRERPIRQLPKPTELPPSELKKIEAMPSTHEVTVPSAQELPPYMRRHEKNLLPAAIPFGRPTRGWSLIAPKRGVQRRRLQRKCGDACFLHPRTRGFPICPRNKCVISCQGLQAAYNRARQWRYKNIATTAEKLLQEKCYEERT
ncbi:MAG: hypothetical protein ACYCOU_02465 [Sulfobacillus sp.]